MENNSYTNVILILMDCKENAKNKNLQNFLFELVVHSYMYRCLCYQTISVYSYMVHVTYLLQTAIHLQVISNISFLIYDSGHCKVDQTEKGWFIAYIDRDPETIERQKVNRYLCTL